MAAFIGQLIGGLISMGIESAREQRWKEKARMLMGQLDAPGDTEPPPTPDEWVF